MADATRYKARLFLSPKQRQRRWATMPVGLNSNEPHFITTADFSKPRLLVIVHPLCNFSKRFLAYAQQQPNSKMLDSALWLATPLHPREFANAYDWNKANPQWQLREPVSLDAWPAIRSWSVPAFYVIHGQKIIGGFVGWPAGEDADRWRQLERLLEISEDAK
jgi:hypothetical protein